MDIHINSGLGGFVLVSEISAVTPDSITGQANLPDAGTGLVMEALAQIGALHVRYQCRFEKHAFLMRVNRYEWSGPDLGPISCVLSGRRMLDTGSASVYALLARSGAKVLGRGEFSFGVIDYDQAFKQEELKDHYQGIFSCLTELKNESGSG